MSVLPMLPGGIMFSRRLLVPVLFLCIIYSLHSSGFGLRSNERGMQEYRYVDSVSPMSLVAAAAAAAKGPGMRKSHIPLQNWQSWSLEQRCQFYFDKTYELNPNWENGKFMDYMENEDVMHLDLSVGLERMRIFDRCFMDSDVAMTAVLDGRSDIFSFHKQMFPFFKKAEESWEEVWPIVSSAQERLVLPKLGNIIDDTRFEVDNSKSFWHNWKAFSKGKGIVLTVGERHYGLLLKLIAVLDFIGNELPIQVVHNGSELSEHFANDIATFLEKTGSQQKVYFVDCGPALDPDWRESKMSFFLNKWLATIFNTFEEIVLLDVDSIPFVRPNTFLEDEQYKKTGMLLFKDRYLNEHIDDKSCISMFQGLQPSAEEIEQWNAINKYSMVNTTVVEPDDVNSTEYEVFTRMFVDRLLHNIDSGLVAIHKSNKLQSLLNSLFIHMAQKTHTQCLYGDKELFWLGQLFSSQDYSVHPSMPGMLGSVNITQPDEMTTEYEMCSAQLAHLDDKGELLWVNGGLQNCKVPAFVDGDVSKHPEYFESKYGNAEKLRSYYESPITVDAVLVPPGSTLWSSIPECSSYTYCSTLMSPKDETPPSLYFNPGHKLFIDALVSTWNQAKSG